MTGNRITAHARWQESYRHQSDLPPQLTRFLNSSVTLRCTPPTVGCMEMASYALPGNGFLTAMKCPVEELKGAALERQERQARATDNATPGRFTSLGASSLPRSRPR
jgi:hypothetical protein